MPAQRDHGVVEPARVLEVGPFSGKLRQQGAEITAGRIGQGQQSHGPEGVDPGAVGTAALRLEPRPKISNPTGVLGVGPGLLEQPGLADARFTGEQEPAPAV